MNDPGKNPTNDLGSNDGAELNPIQTPSESYNGNPDELHDLFAGEVGTDEDDPLAALRNDPNYSALIRDLELIAGEARRLFEPAQETPSDKVWEGIRKGLDKPADA